MELADCNSLATPTFLQVGSVQTSAICWVLNSDVFVRDPGEKLDFPQMRTDVDEGINRRRSMWPNLPGSPLNTDPDPSGCCPACSFRLPQRGESECCCHPHQPIPFAGHKSAPRPGSSGSGKMECDGLVLTNSGGAPSPHLASHHSPHTAQSSPSPHSIWYSRIQPPLPPPTPPRLLWILLLFPPLSFHQRCTLSCTLV